VNHTLIYANHISSRIHVILALIANSFEINPYIKPIDKAYMCDLANSRAELVPLNCGPEK